MTSESKQPSDLILRLKGIAYRDEAKAVTVRAEDLRAVLGLLSTETATAPDFEKAWAGTGYNYGEDALNNVRLGWDLAVAQLRSIAPRLDAPKEPDMNTTTNTRGVSEAMEALRPFANAYLRLRHYGDSPTDETPLYAYAGEGHPLYELLNGEHGERLTVQTLGEAAAALEAALSAEPAAQGEADAPSIEAAEAMGAKGGPAVEAERVPEGWVLVPREPTEAMVAASMIRVEVPRKGTLSVLGARAWEAMLTASPAPSEGGKGVEG